MNTIRRDGTGDDTGEQDVRELRRRHAGSDPLPASEPYVRHREDVPHEQALPDFYGLEDEVDAELSALVDAGELCMGWDSETEEVIYWFPEESTQDKETAPAPKRRSRRAPRKRSNLYRRTLLTLVASVAPFFVGMTAEAALDMHHERNHPMDRPDMAGAVVPDATATTQAADDVTMTADQRPTRATYESAARHAKPATSPTAEKPVSSLGRHRRPLPKHAAKVVREAIRKPESHTPKPAPAPTQKPLAVRPKPPKQKPHTPAETVVVDILGPVESLLG